MSTWNIDTFFRRFEQGTLGRKSQYSTYWVNTFDGCKVLCNKSAGYSGRRDGEVPYGVYMGQELCVFNRQLIGNYSPQFSMEFPKEDEDITESGLIDCEYTAGNNTVRSVLFQLGHSQYLLEPYWAEAQPISYENIQSAPYDKSVNLMEGCSTVQFFGISNHKAYVRGAIKKLPDGNKYSSVKDARAALIPAEVLDCPDSSFQFKNWWFAPAMDYTPKDLTSIEKKILENPPMPWHYGLTTQIVSPILVSPLTFEVNVENLREHIDNKALTMLNQYVQAKKIYSETIKKLRSLYIDQDEEQDFNSFLLLPGQSMAYVQRSSKDKYYIMGDLRTKNDEHFSFRYSGIDKARIDKAYSLPVIKLTVWHAMIKEFENG